MCFSYQRMINHCELEKYEEERKIDQVRAMIKTQQELIKARRADAMKLKLESENLRREADSAAMPYV